MPTSAENATIAALEEELMGLVSGLSEFTDKTYSIFTLADLEALTEGQTNQLPMAGVGYDGAAPAEGNVAEAKSVNAKSSQVINLQYLIVIAVSYRGPNQDDTKPVATNLLGAIRRAVIGYKSINARGWRFIGERPEPEASGDGIIFYSQVWQTAVVVTGNTQHLT